MKGSIEAASEIRKATDRFVAEGVDATHDQWLFRPEPTVWSMAHVVEHVVLGNGNLYSVLAKRLLKGQLATLSADVVDDEIPYLFYRGDEPPNLATPSGEWTDRPKAFESVRAICRLPGGPLNSVVGRRRLFAEIKEVEID